jgi:hypothetical protein
MQKSLLVRRYALKYVAAAGACWAILRVFQTRQAVVRN